MKKKQQQMELDQERDEPVDKISVVIEQSRHRESVSRAVKSVVEMRDSVQQVIFVGEDVNQETLGTSKEWKSDLKKLKEAQIEIVYQEKFNPDKVTASLLLDIPSVMKIHHSKIHFEDKLEPLKQRIVRHQRFAFEGFIDLTLAGGSLSPWYVCLCLIYCVDWWRHVFAWFTFHSGHHVRLVEVLRGYKRAKLADSWSAWLSCCGFGSFGDRAPLQDGRNICKMGPTTNLTGQSFFMYWMQRRSPMGWRGWLFVCTIFYFCAGYPIWPTLIRVFVEAMWRIRAPSSNFTPEALTQLMNALFTLQMFIMTVLVLIHAFIIHLHFRWTKGHRTNQLVCFIIAGLFPFFIPLVIPLVLWWARLSSAFFVYNRTLDPELEEDEDQEEGEDQKNDQE